MPPTKEAEILVSASLAQPDLHILRPRVVIGHVVVLGALKKILGETSASWSVKQPIKDLTYVTLSVTLKT